MDSTQNIVKLFLQTLGLIILISTLSGKKLGKAKIPILAAALAAQGYLATSGLARKAYEKVKSRATVKAAIGWGDFAGSLSESPVPFIKNTIGVAATSLGLADHGFGILNTGFGALSAAAGLLI